MKLPVLRRILKEDLQKAGEVPSWIDALLDPLNEFIDNVTLAFRNNITFPDNFAGKLVSISFTHNVELNVNPGSNAKILGVMPLGALNESTVSFKWVKQIDGSLGITFGFGSGGTTSAVCTIYILYGA